MSKHYEPMVPFKRFRYLIEALESDRDLDRETRDEIKFGLEVLYIKQLIEQDRATPARRVAGWQRAAAYLVHLLVSEHDVRVKAACNAVLPGAETKAIAALAKTYRTMKANDGFGGHSVHPKLLADAVARLPGNK